MYVARDKDGDLYLYKKQPVKYSESWQLCSDNPHDFYKLDSSLFPEVKWEDEEPTEVELVKKYNQITRLDMNKKVIIRGDRSGVFFGELVERNGSEVKLANCRRLWYWDGAASISQLAVNGTTNPSECKFTVTVPEIEILDVIEIIPCSDKAVKSIENVPVWAR